MSKKPIHVLNAEERRLLATKLIAAFKESGAVERQADTRELQFCKRIGRLQVVCYTSIVETRQGYAVRDCGDDAIRIVVMYRSRSGDIRILGKGRRVNRVGEIDSIVSRVMDRFADGYATVQNGGERCNYCNAPMATSKRGNPYCAETCWKR